MIRNSSIIPVILGFGGERIFLYTNIASVIALRDQTVLDLLYYYLHCSQIIIEWNILIGSVCIKWVGMDEARVWHSAVVTMSRLVHTVTHTTQQHTEAKQTNGCRMIMI